MNNSSSRRFVLRDLPLPARLVVGFFLISVGFGYLAALVQIHFQQAGPGRLLPNREDLVRSFSGVAGQSKMAQLLTADEGLPFNGQGTMRPAFTTHSASWKSAIKAKAKEIKTKDLALAEQALRRERDNERAALLAWINAGAPEESYKADRFELPSSLAAEPITDDYLVADDAGKPVKPHALKIKTLLEDRCVRCHDPEKAGEKAAAFPLNTYDEIKPHVEKASTGGMSWKMLAQTTHLHLLSFAMLYSLTGLVISLTGYAVWLRCLLAPWPLAAQLLEISCWWLAKLDSRFAYAIFVLGGLVAAGLCLQILLGLFSLFGRRTVPQEPSLATEQEYSATGS